MQVKPTDLKCSIFSIAHTDFNEFMGATRGARIEIYGICLAVAAAYTFMTNHGG